MPGPPEGPAPRKSPHPMSGLASTGAYAGKVLIRRAKPVRIYGVPASFKYLITFGSTC